MEPAKSEKPRSDPGEGRFVLTRKPDGICSFCGAGPGDMVGSYDPGVYEGLACADCILDGKTNKKFDPKSDAMAPMTFVARALKGDQPFKTYLDQADAQKAGKTISEAVRDLRNRSKRAKDRAVPKVVARVKRQLNEQRKKLKKLRIKRKTKRKARR